MKKSELSSFIKEEIKSTLSTEGIWKKGHPSLIQDFLNELDTLKEKYYNVVGSDDVFNGLDQAERAASELLTMAEATIETSPEDLAKVKKSADKDDIIKVTKEDATPKGEDFFYDYLDIGMSYLDGFGKKHSLDDTQLEKLGKKIVDQLYKGDVGKAYDAIVKRGAMNEDEDKEPSKSDLKKTKGLAKAKEELAQLTKQMKSLARDYKKAEGEEKEKLVADLKKKTKLKKELEAIIDK
ncbi:hypothetical protein N8579_00150 [bacterium]|nr:hypothetical protein [bacterium]